MAANFLTYSGNSWKLIWNTKYFNESGLNGFCTCTSSLHSNKFKFTLKSWCSRPNHRRTSLLYEAMQCMRAGRFTWCHSNAVPSSCGSKDVSITLPYGVRACAAASHACSERSAKKSPSNSRSFRTKCRGRAFEMASASSLLRFILGHNCCRRGQTKAERPCRNDSDGYCSAQFVMRGAETPRGDLAGYEGARGGLSRSG